MRRLLLAGFLVCTSAAAQTAAAPPPQRRPPQPREVQRTAEQQRAETLLRQAYSVLLPLGAAERASLLGRAINVASQVRSPLVKPWAEELFKIAQELPLEQRAAVEMPAVNAVVSSDDVDLALDLLERVEAPGSSHMTFGPGVMGGDSRSRVASGVFSRYFMQHRETGLDRLRTVAARMGQNGTYPYAAFGQIMPLAARQGPAAADALFAEQVQAFHASGGSFAEVGEFTRFLLATNHMVSGPLYREALLSAAAAAQRVPDTTVGMQATFSSATGSAQVSGLDALLLLELLPLLRSVDPAAAQQLLDARSDLAAVDKIRDPKSGSIGGFRSVTYSAAPAGSRTGAGSTTGMVSSMPPGMLARMQLIPVRTLAESSPDQAVRYAQRITDPGARVAADAEIAAGYAGHDDPRDAALYLQQATLGLEQIKDQRQRATALASLAQAAYATGDRNAAGRYMEQGFSASEELLRADYDAHPDREAGALDGAEEMAKLVRTGIRRDPENTLGRIEAVRYPNLKAYLYITAAEEMARQPVNRTPGVTGGIVGSGSRDH